MKREMTEIDNSQALLDRLFALYETQEFCDLQLKVGSQRYSTHRMVLCMSSDVFRTMLTSDTWPESRSNLIVLQEDPECVEVFHLFLKYLYKGQVVLNYLNVLPLLILADKYNVSDLSKSCLQFMVNTVLLEETKHVIIPWLQYAVICGYKTTEVACRTFITYNFEAVVNTPEFVNINEKLLISLLASSDLVISGEYRLYEAVKKWLTANMSECVQEQNKVFTSVMQHIRFPMMHLSEIATLQNDVLVSRHQEFYLNKIFTAMTYHTSEKSSSNFSDKHLWDSQYMPRIYDTESWSTTIAVEYPMIVKEGEVRGAFFTTPASCSDADSHTHLDWHVMFYPHGVEYDKCVMIGVPNNNTIPKHVIKTVRLALSTRCEVRKRFKITVLVIDTNDLYDHNVCKAVTKDAIFDSDHSLFNFDNVVSYDWFRTLYKPIIKVIVRPVYLF